MPTPPECLHTSRAVPTLARRGSLGPLQGERGSLGWASAAPGVRETPSGLPGLGARRRRRAARTSREASDPCSLVTYS